MSCFLTVGSAVLSCAVLSALVVFHCFVSALLFQTVVRLNSLLLDWSVKYDFYFLVRVCWPSVMQC